MLDHNPILQVCSILGAVICAIFLIASFVPELDFDNEVENAAVVRVMVLIVLLGSLPGVL